MGKAIYYDLASVNGRKDEELNIACAKKIVDTNNIHAIDELIELTNHKDQKVQNDSIKVLYTIGEINPNLIATYLNNFLKLLASRNNRMQWGAMSAIHTISTIKQQEVFKYKKQLLQAANKGSVITKDKYMSTLVELAKVKELKPKVWENIKEILSNSPVNQFPMYSEMAFTVCDEKLKKELALLLSSRMPQLDKESKRKRVQKIIDKLT